MLGVLEFGGSREEPQSRWEMVKLIALHNHHHHHTGWSKERNVHQWGRGDGEGGGRGGESEHGPADHEHALQPPAALGPCDCERSWGWADIQAALPTMFILLFTIFVTAVVVPHVFKVDIQAQSLRNKE